MKRSTLFFLPFLLTSCGGTSSTSSTEVIDDGDYYIKEDTTIDFLCMANEHYHDELQAMIDEFKKVEPHVKVNLYNPQGSGSYAMIEKTIVAGFFKNDYPDLAQCYPDNVVKYIAQGYAYNIDEYLNNEKYGILGEEKEDYISNFIQEGQNYTVEGTYSLPFCKSTELMYYNADVLIGLDLSTKDSSINNGKPLDVEYLDNLTWEELFDKLCPAIYAYNEDLADDAKIFKNTSTSGLFTYESDENFFITLANQYGYGYTSINDDGVGSADFNNDEMKALVKKLKTMKDNHYLQTHGSYLDYVSYLFQNKEALFTVSSTAGLSYNYNRDNPFEIGIAKLPHPEGKDYSSINQGPSVCILDHKDDNRSLASYLFWKHITNKENASSWSLATGYMGIRNSCYSAEEYLKALEITEESTLYEKATAEILKKIAEVGEYTFSSSVFRGSSNARTNVGLLLKECLLSSDIDNELDSIFQKYYDLAVEYIK